MARNPLRTANWILYSIGLFLVLLFVWADNAVLEEVTRGQGRVISSSRIQIIQNLEGGIVHAIFVRPGQRVSAGEVLIKFDDTRFRSELAASEQFLASLQASIAVLRAEGADIEPVFSETLQADHPQLVSEVLALHRSRLQALADNQRVLSRQRQELQGQLESAREQLALLEEEEREWIRPLVESGAESKRELNQMQQRITEARGRISQLTNEIASVSARLVAEKSSFITNARQSLQNKLAEYNSRLEQMPALRGRLARTEVRAPLGGIINRLLITTTGGVAQPGSPLLELVPLDDELIVEVEILPDDINHVTLGQRAIIKLTAFDFARYGSLEGKVITVGADSIRRQDGTTWYLCRVEVPKDTVTSLSKHIKIQPGMVAQVDIVSGERSVLQYLLQPVTQVAREAFREH